MDQEQLAALTPHKNRHLQQQKPRSNGFGEARRKAFLQHLAETCNVVASTVKAGVSTSTVYRRRWSDGAFAEQWDIALRTGYVRLEAMLLERAARGADAEPFPLEDVPPPDPGKMEPELALHLLKLHLARMQDKPKGGHRSRPSERDTDRILVRKLRALKVARPPKPE